MHAKDPMLTSVIPEYPFQIVGTDLFLWNGQEYIIVVDYYSRFWEIERLRKTDSSVIIQKLKADFPGMVFLKWLEVTMVHNTVHSYLKILQRNGIFFMKLVVPNIQKAILLRKDQFKQQRTFLKKQ